MKIATINVRGLSSRKRLTLFQWIEHNKIDIVCLQEIFCTQFNFSKFDKDLEGTVFHALSDSQHSRGVAILFKKHFDYESINKFKSQDGRQFMINFTHESQSYSIVTANAPNNESDRFHFFKILQTWINQSL